MPPGVAGQLDRNAPGRSDAGVLRLVVVEEQGYVLKGAGQGEVEIGSDLSAAGADTSMTPARTRLAPPRRGFLPRSDRRNKLKGAESGGPIVSDQQRTYKHGSIERPEKKSRWRVYIDCIKDLGEIVKFLAMLLAVVALIGLYLPDLRTTVQAHFNPSPWYYIGVTTADRFDAEAFQHPSWAGGSGPASLVDTLPNSTMITTGGLPHVGRVSAGPLNPIKTNSVAGLCLYVKETQTLHKVGDTRGFVWARAVKISC